WPERASRPPGRGGRSPCADRAGAGRGCRGPGGVIERLLEHARRRGAGAADALWRRVERTSVAFESGRLKAAGVTEEAGVNLRVVSGGRVGIAGSTAVDAAPEDVVARALGSAELGEILDLAFPPRAPLPQVPTFFDRAAAASLDALIEIGRQLVGELAREGVRSTSPSSARGGGPAARIPSVPRPPTPPRAWRWAPTWGACRGEGGGEGEGGATTCWRSATASTATISRGRPTSRAWCSRSTRGSISP